MNNFIKLSIVGIALLVSACSDSNSAPAGVLDGGESFTAYLIDSPIEGLNYRCGGVTSVTSVGGEFTCSSLPVEFMVGTYSIGFLSSITDDSKVYPQDILGLSRENETDASLIELVQFFQALDDDGDIDEAITINQDMNSLFSGVNGYRVDNDETNSSLGGGTGGSSGGSGGSSGYGMTPSTALEKAGVTSPSPATAMDHLLKSIQPENFAPADTRDKSAFVGKWAGTGWNWEVRFKHTSGDFVGQFSESAMESLPFDKEKIIMSLMVEQKNKFTFDVDESGNITGEGDITYNLIPNLCGLNAIATQGTNALDLLFGLANTSSQFAVGAFVSDSVNFDSWLFNIVNNKTDSVTDVLKTLDDDIVNKMLKKENYMIKESDDSQKVCSVAAGLASVSGGLKIGPSTIEELYDVARFNVAKSLTLDITNPLNFMLNVPGVTKIQYNYKGLQNGPEHRHYTLSGHIDDNGKMFLEVDNIEGSQDLVIEYMVNWQKETPSFPVWSPFLDNSGVVYPANREVTVYDYTTKNVTKTFKDLDGKEQSVVVPVKELKAKKTTLNAPMASFKEVGTQRNGVSVWHEYEYSWNVYKLSEKETDDEEL